METIKCVIADDEPMALELLKSYVEKTPFLELVAACSNAIEAIEIMHNIPNISLYFLDIQMPDLSGLELAKLIPASSKIIFTTAFEKYAIEGYKVNAIDYLLKPFDYSEFLNAVQKVKNIDLEKKLDTDKTFFFVKSDYKQIKINFSSILYIEGLKDYAKIYIQNSDKPILSLITLKKLQEELPEKQFMRIHRSFIIALDKIEALERNHIIINNKAIVISPQYKSELLKYIEGESI